MFGLRFWGLSVLYTFGAALLIGIPTVLIPTIFFKRMTPTNSQDYVIWGISVILIGAVMALATLYPMANSSISSDGGGKRAVVATLLSFFSVGCPICNKLVVFLFGLSGAMTFFNPIRPFLGVASIILLGGTLLLRIRVLRYGCPVNITPTMETSESRR